MSAGLFITFEGGEGVGKSTQFAQLAARLTAEGRQVVTTREPGGTPTGELLRDLLVRGETTKWSPAAETLLVYAARDNHLREVIRPALQAGTIVLCDRFIDSTRVYQGMVVGGDQALIEILNSKIVAPTFPDMTFVLDMKPGAGLERAKARGTTGEDRFERMGDEFHSTIRDGFCTIAKEEPDRCKLVDASAAPDEIADLIYKHVAQRIAP